MGLLELVVFVFVVFALVLVLVVFVFVIGLMVLPSYRGFSLSDDLVVARNTVVQSLNQAQELARSNEGDSDWGVHSVPGRVTIFKGSDFNTRDPSADDFFIIQEGITFLGPTDFIFSKFTGLPQDADQLMISNTINEFEIITVNEQGAVSY